LHGICNALLLQLNECIESTQNEVKRKMSVSVALRSVPKSPCANRSRKNARGELGTMSPAPARAGNLARTENRNDEARALTVTSPDGIARRLRQSIMEAGFVSDRLCTGAHLWLVRVMS
jgi:hypothetical protein